MMMVSRQLDGVGVAVEGGNSVIWPNLARGWSVMMMVSRQLDGVGVSVGGGGKFNDIAESREGLVGDDDGQPSA